MIKNVRGRGESQIVPSPALHPPLGIFVGNFPSGDTHSGLGRPRPASAPSVASAPTPGPARPSRGAKGCCSQAAALR